MPTIVYLDTLPAQNGLDILYSQSKVEILKINSSENEEKCMSILQKADAYQVGAARDEVPKYLQVDKQFLNKAPNLIVVSSSGAGYDTIDVDACTDAGVLVVNQTGGNADIPINILLFKNFMKITKTKVLLFLEFHRETSCKSIQMKQMLLSFAPLNMG